MNIASYLCANCMKQDHRLVQLHYVQLLSKSEIRKVHLSTQFLCKLLLLNCYLNYPVAHTVQQLGGYANNLSGLEPYIIPKWFRKDFNADICCMKLASIIL